MTTIDFIICNNFIYVQHIDSNAPLLYVHIVHIYYITEMGYCEHQNYRRFGVTFGEKSRNLTAVICMKNVVIC